MKKTTQEIVEEILLNETVETEFFDLKEKWHDNSGELVKDIICFSNTVHDKDCYIIIGVTNDFNVVGVPKENRRTQTDLLDTISKLKFGSDSRPTGKLETIIINEKEIDVITIFNEKNTPVYLEKNYGKMKEGCIYSRNRDRNTADDANSSFHQIEMLWRKRFGLTKTKLEIILGLLKNRSHWGENDEGYYHSFFPEYRIVKKEEASRKGTEFYTYALMDNEAEFSQIDLLYNNTILKTIDIVYLDGYRLLISVPTWGFIIEDEYKVGMKYLYKYYVKDSDSEILLNFLYDSKNQEQRYCFMNLEDLFIFYENEQDRPEFEHYINSNKEQFEYELEKNKRYDYLLERSTESFNMEPDVAKLKVGSVLCKMFKEWKNKNRDRNAQS